jgi:hypothetical protein
MYVKKKMKYFLVEVDLALCCRSGSGHIHLSGLCVLDEPLLVISGKILPWCK